MLGLSAKDNCFFNSEEVEFNLVEKVIEVWNLLLAKYMTYFVK